MTAVFLLRHPQTTWNVEQRYQGRLESPVSAEGRRQARRVAQSFARGDLDAIVSSPLRRAHYLADELARVTGAPLQIDNRVTEMGQGIWEGLLVDEIRRKYSDMYGQWYLHPEKVTFPCGENVQSVQERALSTIGDVFERYPLGNVAVVTHSVVIQTLVAAALSLELRHLHQVRVSNAGVTTLCGSETPGSLLSLNATEALYGTAVGSAVAHECVGSKPRRLAS